MTGTGPLAELFAGSRGRVLVFCWLGWVFDFYDLILFSFLRHEVGADLGIGEAWMAWILGIQLAATAVGGFAFGRLADRRGRRRALCWSILVYSAGSLLTALAQGPASLLVGRIVTGLGVGGEWGVGHAIVAETYPDRLRGRAAGQLQAGSPLAMMLAALVFGFATDPLGGWRNVFLVSAAPALLVLFARRAMPGEDRAPGHGGGSLAELFGPRLRRASIALLGLLCLHMTGFWCVYGWLPKGLIAEAGATRHEVALFFVGVNAVHVVADVLFGFLADRFGRRRMFALFSLAFAAGQLVVAALFSELWGDLWSFGLAIALMGLGAGTWSCFGVLFAESYPERVRATAASGFYNLSRGVQLLTQPLMHVLLAVTGTFAVALLVGAVVAVIGAVLVFAVPPPLTAATVPDRCRPPSGPAAGSRPGSHPPQRTDRS